TPGDATSGRGASTSGSDVDKFLESSRRLRRGFLVFSVAVTLFCLTEVKSVITFSDPSRRLELRFRPQDPFCHSVCGNRLPSTNLLLRVRRRVRKKDPKDAEIQMDIVGIIATTYKFQGMVDFQCLAVNSLNGEDTSLYDKIILRKAESPAFFEQDVPNFLPPAIFSRLDCPVDYFYRPDSQQKLPSAEKNLIGLARARRQNNAVFVSFNDPSVPTECLPAAKQNWARFCMKESDRRAEANIREMFERRPIWSRNALKANTNIHPEKLKLLLPLFAYYMVTGPWRCLWVRLGYDPRKNPDSKKYQMLDYRIRCSHTVPNIPVKAKRSAHNYSLSITLNKPLSHVCFTSPPQESSYIFRDGMLPPHRQMFYQLCDLEVDSIKDVIEQNSGNERACDERDGWCVVGTTDKLRDLISAMIRKVVREKKPGTCSHEGCHDVKISPHGPPLDQGHPDFPSVGQNKNLYVPLLFIIS
uniref:Ral transcription factor IIIC subunit 5 n=1 Tax=Nothobranchius furzeri TaxID=105023 RepID=A0A8C6NL56_NOTFU